MHKAVKLKAWRTLIVPGSVWNQLHLMARADGDRLEGKPEIGALSPLTWMR